MQIAFTTRRVKIEGNLRPRLALLYSIASLADLIAEYFPAILKVKVQKKRAKTEAALACEETYEIIRTPIWTEDN